MDALWLSSKRVVETIDPGDPMPAFCVAQDLVDQFEAQTDISDLAARTADPSSDQEQVHVIVVWIESCLRNPRGIRSNKESREAAAKLAIWLVDILKPSGLFGWRAAYDPDPLNEVSTAEKHQSQLRSVAGLRALASLIRVAPEAFEQTNSEILVAAAIFTDPTDPWTRRECYDAAVALFQQYQKIHQQILPSTVLSILKEHVKPSFSRQNQPGITSAGRKAMSVPGVEPSFFQTPEAEEKPWKFHQPWVTTVFLWCVKQVEIAQINDLWPQLTPPTLAMMDDGAIPFKVKGCQALREILSKTDGEVLERTGLGDVFEQALLPMLVLLPTLTEEQDSLLMLSEAFPTLRQLAEVRFGSARGSKSRQKSLDAILRTGVIRGFSYAGDYPKIGVLLATELARIVDAMAIDAVKHLKSIVPLVVEILCNPFATASPLLLQTSVTALQTIILNCWPRIRVYAGDILKGLTICWCRLVDEGLLDGILEVQNAIENALKLLKAAIQDEDGATRDLEYALKTDERLRGLQEALKSPD